MVSSVTGCVTVTKAVKTSAVGVAAGGGHPSTEKSEYREQANASSILNVEETNPLLLIPLLLGLVTVKKVVLPDGVGWVGSVRVLVGVTVT